MPQLLIEFFSEEIPARMQGKAAEDLLRLLEAQLSEAGLKGESAKAYAGPRRLAVVIDGLPERTADLKEERKGPRVGAPEQALAGFLKAAGLSSIDQAVVQDDPKGAFYVARIDKPGRPSAEIIAQALPAVAKSFPWPKSMRSGTSDFYWVRPLQSVVALFGGKVVECEIGGVKAGRLTRGHRFHAPSSFDVSDFEDYAAKLRASWVVLDATERKALILERAKKLCADAGLELVEDAGLLDEVSGLVEWPVPVLGKMDPAFLDLPAEVIRLSMRTHQKYFAVRDPSTGKLAPNFVTVANIDAVDGGKAIAAGNARVLSARLNDAKYFWDLDRFYDPIERTKPKALDAPERIEKLKQIVFHQKLGSVWDKVERVRALAKELCAVTGADPALVDRAAVLSKCDLVTEVVGEFPELQGQIGRQLYLLERGIGGETRAPSPSSVAQRPNHQELLGSASDPSVGEGSGRGGSQDTLHSSNSAPHPLTPSPQGGGGSGDGAHSGDASVALAIEDHYRPLGPNDRVPTDPVAVTLALADKIDTLVGFWAIDEKPTGSSDPFALRRAALGALRIILDHNLRFFDEDEDDGDTGFKSRLSLRLRPHVQLRAEQDPEFLKGLSAYRLPMSQTGLQAQLLAEPDASADSIGLVYAHSIELADQLFGFLVDRLKVRLRDQGKRHDLVAAALTTVDMGIRASDDDLVRIVARVEALEAFLKTDDGANLLAGYKRAVNILRAEEKKTPDLIAELAREAAGSEAASTSMSAPHPLTPSPQGGGETALHSVNVSAEEAALARALAAADLQSAAKLETEDFAGAMAALAGLRQPVDAFFEKVLVNDPDPMLRRSRLLLLSRVRAALERVADFSQIEG